MNSWALLTVGPLIEEIYGASRFYVVYLLTGIGAGAGIMAGVGVEALANKAMSHLLFDPKFTKLLTEGIKFQIRGDEAGARLIGEALSRIADKTLPLDEPPTGGGPPLIPPGGGQPPPAGQGGGIRQKLKEGLRGFSWADVALTTSRTGL
jgi:hypothetical protein